ncbi:uncharacterized protein NPIL_17101 [Nephila pilipes]|uniref:Uncharacterized protein n=1 Tax=Nephila pilipes TaxID=299642 RepID=A0A8X6TMC0_NEPPI|nr:uncharacterized protein NPIL_17101 [Nephila pilipes]
MNIKPDNTKLNSKRKLKNEGVDIPSKVSRRMASLMMAPPDPVVENNNDPAMEVDENDPALVAGNDPALENNNEPAVVADNNPTLETGNDEPAVVASNDPTLENNNEPILEAGNDEPAVVAGNDPTLETGNDEPAMVAETGNDEPAVVAGNDPTLENNNEPTLETGNDEPAAVVGNDPTLENNNEPTLEAGNENPILETGNDPILEIFPENSPEEDLKEEYYPTKEYARTLLQHEKYAVTHNGGEVYNPFTPRYATYPVLVNGVTHNVQYIAKNNEGNPNFLLDEEGMIIYPFDLTANVPMFPRNEAGDEGYFRVNDKDHYPRDISGTPIYAKNWHGQEVPPFNEKNEPFYAMDVNGKEIYPKDSNGDEYYLWFVWTHIPAKNNKGYPYYAKDRLGNEMYPRRLYSKPPTE